MQKKFKFRKEVIFVEEKQFKDLIQAIEMMSFGIRQLCGSVDRATYTKQNTTNYFLIACTSVISSGLTVFILRWLS